MTARTLSLAATLALLAAGAPAPGAAQRLTGRVLEQGSNRPVSGAAVSLVDRSGKARAQTIADSLGRFSVEPPKAGDYQFVAQRLGYETTRSPLFSMKVEGDVQLDLVMAAEPIGLEGLEVSTESEAVRTLRSFGHTPADLGPRWIDRKKIEKVRAASHLTDVIRWQAIPGVHVRVVNASPSSEPLCVETLRSSHPGCSLTVLNGVVTNPVDVNQLDPQSIEAIAVLSPMDAATLFGTQGGNGAVLIWTRTGGH